MKMQAIRSYTIVAPSSFQVIFLFRAGQSIESIKIVTMEEKSLAEQLGEDCSTRSAISLLSNPSVLAAALAYTRLCK